MTRPWRPQLLWLPMGGLLGALSGALTGMAVLLVVLLVDLLEPGVANEGFWGSVGLIVIVGAWFGGMAGLVVGLFVGVELMFLVGAHLPRDVARRRAHRLGFVLPPLTMVVPFAVQWLLGGDLHVSPINADDWFWVVALTGASLLGGPLARWLAGFQPPVPPVS